MRYHQEIYAYLGQWILRSNSSRTSGRLVAFDGARHELFCTVKANESAALRSSNPKSALVSGARPVRGDRDTSFKIRKIITIFGRYHYDLFAFVGV